MSLQFYSVLAEAQRVEHLLLARPEMLDNSVAPGDSIKRGLAESWQELLGTRVISRVRESFQVELPLAALFASERE